MAELIQQDSSSIKNISDVIRKNGEDFLNYAHQMFDDMSKEIGFDQAHATWYGPQAQQFIDNVNTKREEFDKAGKNIKEMADNLENQAQSWENFENS